MYDAAFNNIENILRAEDGIANEQLTREALATFLE